MLFRAKNMTSGQIEYKGATIGQQAAKDLAKAITEPYETLMVEGLTEGFVQD